MNTTVTYLIQLVAGCLILSSLFIACEAIWHWNRRRVETARRNRLLRLQRNAAACQRVIR